MKIVLIAAVDQSWIIGSDNQIPWKNSADMKHFKETTTGKIVIMGRKTFESLGSKPLPNRINIVITSNNELPVNSSDTACRVKRGSILTSKCVEGKNLFIVEDSSVALDVVMSIDPRSEVFVIGGASIYQQFLNIADSAMISMLNESVDPASAVFFPKGMLDTFMNPRETKWIAGKNRAENFLLVTYERKRVNH